MIRVLLPLLLLLPLVRPAGAAEETDLDTRQAELQAGYDAYETGLDAAQSGDYATAIREFRRAAENGLDVAQYNLGVLYYTGRGVEPDPSRALHWLERAARQGHTAAQFNVGVLYFNGEGINEGWQEIWPVSLWTRSRNRTEAAVWYERAAESGHAEAQYYLATLYQQGLGVAPDPVLAHVWARTARDNDHPEAARLLDSLEAGMDDEQINEARRLYADRSLGDN